MSANVRVRLKSVAPAGPELLFELVGDDQLSGGVGTWDVLARPRRDEAVEWTGTTGFTYVLPLLLNGMETAPGQNSSVEPDCRTLQAWAGEKASTGRPTVVKATGPLQTADTIRWVITDLAWGEKVRNADGRRIQQHVTVTLRQFSQARVLRGPASKSKKGRGK